MERRCERTVSQHGRARFNAAHAMAPMGARESRTGASVTRVPAGYPQSRSQGSKGSVRFPLDRPLPLGLVGRMVKFRVQENEKKRRRKSRAFAKGDSGHLDPEWKSVEERPGRR